jgi:uncharacterized protein YlxP (DUF503 family)
VVVAVVRARFNVHSWTSLKEKRRFVQSVKSRARSGFGVSAAETGLLDDRHGCELGFALAASDRRSAERTVQSLRYFLQSESQDQATEIAVDIEQW